MHDHSAYPGQELELFERAVNWKKYFASYIKPYIGAEVAEVGAGLGANTVLLFNRIATKWMLLEPDSTMASLLTKKIADQELPAACEVVQGTLSSLKQNVLFDTIIYIDVLEHIEHDKKEIETAAQLLKPKGHLIILSPAFGFLYSSFDKAIGHYRRYKKQELENLIPVSLKKKSLRYLDSAGFLMSLTNRLVLKQKYPTQQQVNFWDRFGIPVSRVMDKILFFSFGKSILGIWEKK